MEHPKPDLIDLTQTPPSSPEADPDFKPPSQEEEDSDSSALEEEGNKADEKYASQEEESEESASSSDEEFAPRRLMNVARDIHSVLAKHNIRRKSHVAKSDISQEFMNIVKEFCKEGVEMIPNKQVSHLLVDVLDENDKVIEQHQLKQ